MSQLKRIIIGIIKRLQNQEILKTIHIPKTETTRKKNFGHIFMPKLYHHGDIIA